jgi:hypothetical protein
MVPGEFYDLDPPAKIGNEEFSRVKCITELPDGRYCVKGIPVGGREEKLFNLRFVPNQGTNVSVSSEKQLSSGDFGWSRLASRAPRAGKPN